MITETYRQDIRNLYEGLASVYDLLTADHDHELWLAALLDLADAHLPAGRRALDCGCGTGRSIEPLARRGWDVSGIDSSARMLEHAAQRVPSATLLLHDLRAAPVIGSFDLVYALCDVVNYARDESELVAVLRTLRLNVADDGLVLFDANTLAAYEQLFCAPAVLEDDAHMVVARGAFDADDGTATATLDVLHEVAAGEWAGRRLLERQQRHDPATIARCTEHAGLRIVDVVGHGPEVRIERPLDERRHTKAIYLAVPTTRR